MQVGPRHFSIIIAGYKDTAKQTLEACLAFEVNDEVSCEVIFLDNTPDSRHRQMAEAAFAADGVTASRSLYIPHTTPGKAATQNLGIREARGRFLVFLDDDVLPLPSLIVAYDNGFRAHACGAIQGRVSLLFEDPKSVPGWLNARFRLDLAEMDFGEPIIPFEMGLTGANMAFRAEMFERYGHFDERFGPGRTGTLEDQEFSERLRKGGEVQLYWPEAGVLHRIPPRRLTFRSFCGIYFDVGHSDYLLSRGLVKGGGVRFTAYSIKEAMKCGLRAVGLLACGRRSDALVATCEICRVYGYWKQAVRHLRWVAG